MPTTYTQATYTQTIDSLNSALAKTQPGTPAYTSILNQINTVKNDYTTQVKVSINNVQAAQQQTASASQTGNIAAILAGQAAIAATVAIVKSQKSTIDLSTKSTDAVENIIKPTNDNASVTASADKVANAGVVGNPNGDPNPNAVITPGTGSNPVANVDVTGQMQGKLDTSMPKIPAPITPTIISKNPSGPPDHRVKIIVPDSYIQMATRGNIMDGSGGHIFTNNGIVFPYTPTISYEHKADYTDQKIMHGNYNQYFYQRSYVTPFTITGKFTVQNDGDAMAYLATVHLLRALTKMLYGGDTGDEMSGSPPPVCRLKAYGDYMLDGVPISITGVKFELPDAVDYYTLGNVSPNRVFGRTTVPTLSSITVTCIPMYSRAEQQKFSVKSWLAGDLRKKGYL
jgi:hypothetical protein